MADLVSGLLGVLLATNQPLAASNFVAERTGIKIEVTDTNNPVEREYLRLMEMDNSAQAEVDHWIEEDNKLAGKGAASEQGTLRGKIRQRLDPVDKAYRDFLARNPNHTNARLAYASFLTDIGREDEAREHLVKARDSDPKSPAAWNNLANYYGHNGPVLQAFECYEKAIGLKPNEPVYYRNFATTVYLFRRDATNYFKIGEQEVFDKAMALYRKAFSLTPDDFLLASDLAQTYYGIKPPRIKDAMEAWTTALKLARDDIEREGIHVHLARWYRTAGDYASARRELNLITNEMYTLTRSNVLRMVEKDAAKANDAEKSGAEEAVSK